MARSGEASRQIEVKYVVFWRSEDGHWKWHVDIWTKIHNGMDATKWHSTCYFPTGQLSFAIVT